MPLTPEEQEARLRELASDDMVIAMARLEEAIWLWLFWPFSRARLAVLMAALHEIMNVQVNRLMGTVGAMLRTYDARLTDLEQRMAALEAWRDEAGRQ